MKAHDVFRFFVWAFLIMGALTFWGWVLFFNGWIWLLLTGISVTAAVLAYYFMCKAKREGL